MRQSRLRATKFVPALASLLALLVVPALHGWLSHAHGECAAQQACLEGGAAADLSGEPSEVCGICLATSRARSAAPAQVALGVVAPQSVAGCVAPASRAPERDLLLLAPAAPRAPPISA